MIKDVFVFKKNAWHVNLMKFIWGYTHEDFKNMCPYFWLSVLNVFIVTPIAIIKLIGVILYGLYKLVASSRVLVDKLCESKAMKWIAAKTEKLWIDDDFAAEVIRLKDSHGNTRNKKYRRLWNSLSTDQRDRLLENYYKKEEERRELKRKRRQEEEERMLKWETANAEKLKKKEEKAQARTAARSARIGRIANISKKIFSVIIWPILLGILALIGWGGYALVTKVYWGWFPDFAIWVGIIVGGLASVILFIWPLVVFFDWIKCKIDGYCIPCEKRRKALKKFFKFCFGWAIPVFKTIWRPFAYIGIAIGDFFYAMAKGFSFVAGMFFAWKKNNCPALEWVDEDQE